MSGLEHAEHPHGLKRWLFTTNHKDIGTLYLRSMAGHFTADKHFAFEGVAWYWHFVDVVWLFLFICVYWL